MFKRFYLNGLQTLSNAILRFLFFFIIIIFILRYYQKLWLSLRITNSEIFQDFDEALMIKLAFNSSGGGANDNVLRPTRIMLSPSKYIKTWKSLQI